MFPGQHYSTFVPQYSYQPPDEWQEEPDYAQEGEGSLEEERDAWFEFRSVVATPMIPTTACAFDPLEELLWTGSAAGRLVSYLNPGMERYTSRNVARHHHESRHEIRSILVEEEGVVTVTPDAVKFFTRGGLLQSTCSNEQMTGLSCAFVNNRSRHEVLLGGEALALLSYDLERGRILKEVLPFTSMNED